MKKHKWLVVVVILGSLFIFATTLIDLAHQVKGTLPVANGGTGVTSSTGSGANVLSTSPALVTPGIDVATGTSLAVTGALSTGANSGAAGLLNFLGSTSGTATLTAPAIAGTSTNPLTSSNVLNIPIGTVTAGQGAIQFGASGAQLGEAGGLVFLIGGSNDFFVASNSGIVGVGASHDVGFSRNAAGVMAIGDATTAGTTTTKVKASGYMSVGTKLTTNAGCGESAGTIVGGATAGKITTAGSTSCTTIITMGDTATAPNGWDCSVTDLTTAADAHNPRLSASNATTATIITGTIVAADVLSVSCIGY